MDKTKISLSQAEMHLVCNTNWILTKNLILEKVKIMFGELQPRYKKIMIHTPGVAREILYSTPKISKGENYQGLPWMMLDYPRCFGQEDIFAIRTFFWWGNFFSITLHLSGQYLKQYKDNILSHSAALKTELFFVCINENPWEHHFDKNNYSLLKNLPDDEWERLWHAKKFIKLAKKISLSEWDRCINQMEKIFQRLIGLGSN